MTVRSLSQPAHIAVVGSGHVGLVTAACLAKLGHTVIGVDRSADLVEQLSQGRIHIVEPGLQELVDSGRESGRLTFTTSYEEAVQPADFVFIAVDTPSTLGGASDLRNVRSAVRSVSAAVGSKTPIVVNKSTTPVGTGETIIGILTRAWGGRRRPAVVSNPEFLRQGRGVHDFLNPERIVVGGEPAAAQAVAELYRGISAPRIVTELRTAEMIKYVANAFLATRVSFINEIARLCEAVGVEVDDVIDGVAPDPRIGRHMFNAGMGYGGSCLPKDVAALRYLGETVGAPTPLLQAVQTVNDSARASAVRKLRAQMGSLEGKVIAAWGVTFKGGTEDARDSPAADVIGLLLNEGATVRAYDPAAPASAPAAVRELYCADALDAVRGADALIVLTDWADFGAVPLAEVRSLMRGALIIDGRNVLSKAAAVELGFTYAGVGRPASDRRGVTARAAPPAA